MQVIDDFLTYLAGDRAYSKQTIETYRIALQDFENYFVHLDEGLNWQTIDADIVRQWVAMEMEQGHGGRTMSKKLSAVRFLYRYLLRMGRVRVNPTSLVKNPKASKPLPAFVKESEMDRLFDEVVFPQNFTGVRDRTILLTFYTTGIRVTELMGLNVPDVNLSAGELKVTGKRSKQRIVPFGPELNRSLRDYLMERSRQACETEALFLDEKNRRINYGRVRQLVENYLSLVTTQKKKSPHVLRHTFATVMLNHGADLEAIKQLLGHESIGTTEIYTHTTFAELKKEYEQAHPRA